MKMNRWNNLIIKSGTLNSGCQGHQLQERYDKKPGIVEGDSILNINTKRSLSVNSFTNTVSKPTSAICTPKSTVNLINLKDLTQNINNRKLADEPEEALSTILPRSRNGNNKAFMSVNSSDVEISALFESKRDNKENERFDIYNQMLMFTNGSSTSK